MSYIKVNKSQDGVYLDTAYSRRLVDRDTAGTVVEMVDNSGGQPDPNPAGMTYKKSKSKYIQLSLE